MISELDVEMAYKYLLGREPESREVVADKAREHDSIDALRRAMLLSDEFADKFARLREDEALPAPEQAHAEQA